MAPHWACSPSRNNRPLIRSRTSYYMKSLTYLLAAFSCGYTAQCLAGIAGLMPGPFFIVGFAAAVYTLSQAYKRDR
jgi:hypothetical protein